MNRRFWRDVWTVLRKEWLEWLATPGCLIQPLAVILIFGVLAPVAAGRLWIDQPIIQWLWSWLPLALSAGMVADTFAGERERDTLEALLASRLPDRAIVLGKVAAVAAYGWIVTLACWVTGWAAVLVALDATLPNPSFVLAWLLLLSFLASCFIACLGVFISLRAQSVRQAQQLMSVAMLVSLLLLGLLATELVTTGTGEQTGQVLTVVALILIVLDFILLAGLLIRPQRSEWLIY